MLVAVKGIDCFHVPLLLQWFLLHSYRCVTRDYRSVTGVYQLLQGCFHKLVFINWRSFYKNFIILKSSTAVEWSRADTKVAHQVFRVIMKSYCVYLLVKVMRCISTNIDQKTLLYSRHLHNEGQKLVIADFVDVL